MPELPEVETIVRGLRRKIIGKKIMSIDLRYQPLFALGKPKDIIHDQFSLVSRHGKYIILTTKKKTHIIVHLRMTGQLLVTDRQYHADKHVHLIMYFADKTQLVYRDIRKFGRWLIVPRNKKPQDFINAGEDALAITPQKIKILMERSTQRGLKAFLLDQTALAGIGNIYADEICFALGVDPETPLIKVKPLDLCRTMQDILLLAIKHKGTSVSDYLTSAGAKGDFQNKLKVYKQKNCPRCGNVIQKKKVAGRTSHYCRQCQR
jgi:formamidopyrimidine-DNA glycosylase